QVDKMSLGIGNQTQPQQRVSEHIRQQLGAKVDGGEGEQQQGKQQRVGPHGSQTKLHHHKNKRQPGGRLHQGVLKGNRLGTGCAPASEKHVTEQRNIVPRPQGGATLGAVGGGKGDIELMLRRRVLLGGNPEKIPGIPLPLGLQLAGQAVDDDVDKASYTQPDDQARAIKHQHLFIDHPTTFPRLKMGRYMAINSPPTSTPSTDMIRGSSSAVRLSTWLSTDSS